MIHYITKREVFAFPSLHYVSTVLLYPVELLIRFCHLRVLVLPYRGSRALLLDVNCNFMLIRTHMHFFRYSPGNPLARSIVSARGTQSAPATGHRRRLRTTPSCRRGGVQSVLRSLCTVYTTCSTMKNMYH